MCTTWSDASAGRHRSVFLAAWLLLWLAAPASALEEDLRQPIRIQADRAELDEAAGVSIYRGSVLYRQGSIRLEAERLTLRAAPDGRGLEEVVAEGRPAAYRQLVEGEAGSEELRAWARRITYRAGPEEIVVLEGEARLEQGRRRFSGHRIVYRLAAQAVEATRGETGARVEVVLPPPRAGDEAQPRREAPGP